MLTVLAGLALTLGGADTPPPPLLGGAVDDRVAAVMRPSRSAWAGPIRAASLPAPRWRAFAACVEQRESHGNPTSVNKQSGAAGLHQWLPDWQRGLAWNVRGRLIDYGVPRPAANAIRAHLAATPIHRWPALYQRVGFADQLSRPGGWRHWSLRGSRCEGLVP